MKRAIKSEDTYKVGQLAEKMARVERKICQTASKTAWDFVTAHQTVSLSIEKSNV